MSAPGRFKKLTTEVQKVIVDTLSAGVDRKHAALRSGISERTLLRWLRYGRLKRAPEFESFLSAVKKAEADAVSRNVAIISKAAQGGTWTAAAWLLERRHPELYGSDRREISSLKKELADTKQKLADAVRQKPGGAEFIELTSADDALLSGSP
jgi:hypothetical protein